MTEFIIVFPVLFILIFAAFQFALLYHAKITLNYATFLAARSGAVSNGHLGIMENALARGMAPLYTHCDDAAEVMRARDHVREEIKKGFAYVVSVAGLFFTEQVEIGDFLIADTDAPTVLTDWIILNKNVGGFASGSVIFADSLGNLTQDNANLFWDTVNKRAGYGTNIPGSRVEIKGAGLTSSTSSLNVTDSLGNSLFFVRDDGRVGFGNDDPSVEVELRKDRVGSLINQVKNTNAGGTSNILVKNDADNFFNVFCDGSNTAFGNIMGQARDNLGGMLAVGLNVIFGTFTPGKSLTLGTSNIQRLVIDSDGAVDILKKLDDTLSQISCYSPTTENAPILQFRRSNTSGLGSLITTVDNNPLGSIEFFGVGSSVPSFDQSAFIMVIQDGAAGTTVVPTEMLFATSPGGTTVPQTRIKIKPDGRVLMISVRLQQAKGADVASADEITLGDDGNYFDITGTTTINHIDNTNWQEGSTIVLHFDASVTVTHNASTPSGTEASILLNGSVNLSAVAGNTLMLIYNGVEFEEITRR